MHCIDKSIHIYFVSYTFFEINNLIIQVAMTVPISFWPSEVYCNNICKNALYDPRKLSALQKLSKMGMGRLQPITTLQNSTTPHLTEVHLFDHAPLPLVPTLINTPTIYSWGSWSTWSSWSTWDRFTFLTITSWATWETSWPYVTCRKEE